MWEAVAGDAAKAFAGSLGGSLGGQPAQSGVSGQSSFDSSGWNVNFGAGSIRSDREQKQAGNFDQYIPYVIAAAGVLIVWRLTRKR